MEEKRLTKSSGNRMICGVCGGIGEYLKIDPTVIRLAWALLTFGSIGTCLIVYIIAAIIMPEQ